MTPHCAPETATPTALEIQGGTPLVGTAVVDGSKNAALPLLAAAACLQNQVELWGVPACADVEAMLSLLQRLRWAVSLRKDLSQSPWARCRLEVGSLTLPMQPRSAPLTTWWHR